MLSLKTKKQRVNWIVAASITLFAALGLVATSTTYAKEKSVAEEILEILKQNNQITDQQYERLMDKAKKEKLTKSDWEVLWKDGIRVESKDGKHKIKLGGRVQVDFASINADDTLKEAYPDLQGNGWEFRTVRLDVEGTLWRYFQFKAQYDFAGQDVDFKDVWVGMKSIPYINYIRVGHMKEPFSLNELTSSNYITFMERALPNVFAPSRNTGIAAHNSHLNDRIWWGFGGFKLTDDSGDAFTNRSDWNITARMTGLPWVDEDKLLHLGLSYTHQFRSGADNPIQYRQRPESHITDERLVDTGSMPVDGVDIINPELAFVYGPFSLQGEYFFSWVNAAEGEIIDDGDPFPDSRLDFQGAYAFISYFLTGESRPYKNGRFQRVRPFRNFSFKEPGWGAFETAFRWSFVDLDDESIDGGKENNFTVGLTWYPNPNFRWMFNYVRADVDQHADMDDDGWANIFETRFQAAF
jgi:phosphate-selective porin OprO/OprP